MSDANVNFEPDPEEAGMIVSARQQTAMVQVGASRAAQEVQAAMVVAKKFPRDETAAFARILKACKRKSLAEAALYAYPRGGTTITGPSIRLAEVLAQHWGNIDFGIIELEQRGHESTMMAYSWDLETNTRSTKVFTVRHQRHTKQGVTVLHDPRDIYEMTANQGARRLRACVLAIIPGDIIEAAQNECERTMEGNNQEPLSDRLRKMVAVFGELGVNPEMVEKRLGHRFEVTNETELVGLRKIYASIRDNMAGIDQFFDVAPKEAPKATMGAQAVLDRLPHAPKPEVAAPIEQYTDERPPDEPPPTDPGKIDLFGGGTGDQWR